MTALNKIFVLALSLLAGRAHAQTGGVTAQLGPVNTAGFYRINITPQLTAGAKSDLSDLRIYDAGRKPVPYLLRAAAAGIKGGSFTPFPLTSSQADSTTTIEMENVTAGPVSSLLLSMANSAADREAFLSGSNDRRSWFVINEHIPLRSPASGTSGSTALSLQFPVVHYRYLRLRIANGKGDPLNVLQAGTVQEGGDTGAAVVLNPEPMVRQKDSSDGFTYVEVKQPAAFLVDRILVRVAAPRYFTRSVQVFAGDDKQKTEWARSELRPGTPSVLDIAPAKGQQWLLRIDNGDNPPLQVTSVNTAQVQRYVVAYLQPGAAYSIEAGNSQLAAPQYDLARFQDSIPQSLPLLGMGPLQPKEKVMIEVKPAASSRAWWLWAAILLGVLALGALTWKLLTEMKRGNTEGA